MFSTTIIPTIGRASLTRAVNSVLSQRLLDAEFEIIVVNDSGKDLEHADWQHADQVRVINTQQRERGVARNTGAALAHGKYLHFLDDDDYLLPEALETFYRFSQKSPAAWLYGVTQIVDRADEFITWLDPQLNGNRFVHVIAGEWIPPQSSLIEARAFFEAGGYHPHMVFSEDVDLCRRIALQGDFLCINKVVACVAMGDENSTTNYANPDRQYLWGRERILDDPRALSRMRASADTSYWYGRIPRAYLTSAVWNLKHLRIFNTVSRVVFGLGSIVLTGNHMTSQKFWQALLTSHQSNSFRKRLAEPASDLVS